MWPKVITGILASVILILVGMTIFFYSSLRGMIVSPVSIVPTLLPGQSPAPTPTPDPLAPFSVLLMGYGGPTHDGGYLTDTIIVARIEPKLKRLTMISVPRDLWVNLPVPETSPRGYKINHAYAIGLDPRNYPNKPAAYTGEAGGGQLAKYAIEQVLGYRVDYFVALGFAGFTKSIDSLGGVDVSVERSFSDPWYPLDGKKDDTCGKSEEEMNLVAATLSGELLEQSFTCRYETLEFTRGLTHMDGITALKYVRSRHSPTDGNDFARSGRQRMLLSAVKDKIFSIGFLPKIIPFVSSLKGEVQTDIDLDTMKKLLDLATDGNSYSITSLALTTDNVLVASQSADRQFMLVPKTGTGNWQIVRDFIRQQSASQSAQTKTN